MLELEQILLIPRQHWITSSSKGFLVPRLSTTERDGISGPATGLLVFDTDLENFMLFNGSAWRSIYSSPGVGLGTYYYRDGDGDAYGDPSILLFVPSDETPPANYITDNNDCDDSDATVYPGATEICDGKDNDCNAGTADGSGESPTVSCLAYGVCLGVTPTCGGADGWVCDYPATYEEIETLCDNLDNDCDDEIDEVENSSRYWDFDVDGYGRDAPAPCVGGSWQGAAISGDCDDTDPDINPMATETCATFYDDNCDGQMNEAGAIGCTIYYLDNDGDGYGSSSLMCLCGPSAPYNTLVGGDCNDFDADINPGATEICNTVDDDCDGVANNGFTDLDGDQVPDCLDDDIDGDGVLNASDNCEFIYNPGQEDADSDGIGDACDFN
ncbi:MAG: thrombospondin type 3 repeat-containing protein [Bacteroidetes bacterium]|nr:thrombospondin type 3 repeat-containing protein [Bacteroidota bacterium]